MANLWFKMPRRNEFDEKNLKIWFFLKIDYFPSTIFIVIFSTYKYLSKTKRWWVTNYRADTSVFTKYFDQYFYFNLFKYILNFSIIENYFPYEKWLFDPKNIFLPPNSQNTKTSTSWVQRCVLIWRWNWQTDRSSGQV